MKSKTILSIALAAILSACSSSSYYDDYQEALKSSSNEPNTEVKAITRSGVTVLQEETNAVPVTNKLTAYFYIRVDNRIPGSGSYPVNQYYPQKDNQGSPKMDYNYGTIFNIENWSTSTTEPTKYIYDTTGKSIPVVTAPNLENFLSKSGVNVNSDTLKVIWYIAKYESGFWHVDGVLTGNSTKDITEIPGIDKDENKVNRADSTGHIEVDIHQQKHNTWQQIKTSIHVRDTVNTNVTVIIPIDSQYVCKQDDTVLRVYEYYSYVTNSKVSTINVKYNANNITIKVWVDPQYIKDLMLNDDGLTFEINNYIKSTLTKEELWKQLKDSKVETDSKKKGQITSTYNDEKIEF